MSYALVHHALAQPLPPARRAVLMTLADMANQAGLCWPSIATLAHKCCVSVRTVYSHLKALECAGLLVRRTRVGRSSVYSVTLGSGVQQGDQAPAAVAGESTPTTGPAHVLEAIQAHTTLMPQPVAEMPPTPDAATPPTVGSVVDAMRAAGLMGAYDCPALGDLVATSANADEFTEAAAHAVKRGKGFAWALARVAGRRKDAAAGGRPAHVRLADVARSTVPSRPGRDPVLLQLEAEAAKAAQPSPSIRERLAQLRATFVARPANQYARGDQI